MPRLRLLTVNVQAFETKTVRLLLPGTDHIVHGEQSTVISAAKVRMTAGLSAGGGTFRAAASSGET